MGMLLMAKRKKSNQKKGHRRPRPITSFRRREENTRKSRERILIVCEGDKTEPKYFESLRAEFKLGTVIVVEGGEWGSAPISVVDYALSRDERVSRRRKTRQKGQTSEPPFGEVWCVFDVDQHESFHRAVDKARANGLELVVSNPAFEYWYLLHFKETDRPFADASEVISHSRSISQITTRVMCLTIYLTVLMRPSGGRVVSWLIAQTKMMIFPTRPR